MLISSVVLRRQFLLIVGTVCADITTPGDYEGSVPNPTPSSDYIPLGRRCALGHFAGFAVDSFRNCQTKENPVRGGDSNGAGPGGGAIRRCCASTVDGHYQRLPLSNITIPRRRPYFGGCSSLLSQPVVVSLLRGAGRSQSRHWSLRGPLPPGGSARIK
jgi:hypothetical protein